VDGHRQAAWPARRPVPSSVARAKRLPGVRPSAQTLGSRLQRFGARQRRWGGSRRRMPNALLVRRVGDSHQRWCYFVLAARQRVLVPLASSHGASRVAVPSIRAPLVGRTSVGASAPACAWPLSAWAAAPSRRAAVRARAREPAPVGSAQPGRRSCHSSSCTRRSSQRLHGTSVALHQVLLPNPSLKRDCHRQGTWPARPSFLSSASRAKRLTGVSPLAQTLGVTIRRPNRRYHS